MTTAEAVTGTVVAMRRPAVHASTLVRSDVAHTFDVFVRTIGAWWPVQRMSGGRDRVRDVTVEQQVGGHVYETWDDGTTREWGEVLAWDPPHRFVMTWRSTPVPTEVELGFTALGPALTRVTVEHRGWEALTEAQLREDCGAPGGYSTGSYDHGWQLVLDSFAAALAASEAHDLPEITDEYMLEKLATTKAYTFLLLTQGPNWDHPDHDKIIWEHGRRNFALREDGVLAIVCPIIDDTARCGIGLFNATVEETERIYADDPAVRAGVLTFEVHPVRSFPNDRLPR
jgi:uncharacterized protein YndB with AHSA1/START domain